MKGKTMKSINYTMLIMFLPCFSLLAHSGKLKASPAARAIAYQTTLRFLNMHTENIVRPNFLREMTHSMLKAVDATSKKYQLPINAHLKASSKAWQNVRLAEKDIGQVYSDSYHTALEHLSNYETEHTLLNETFSTFESDLSHITRPW